MPVITTQLAINYIEINANNANMRYINGNIVNLRVRHA